jgi:hypothetical protein
MAKIFQMSVHISKSNFLGSIFPFPSHGMAKIFKFQKQKFSIQISKTKKINFLFQIFLVASKIFFSALKLPNLLKDCKNYLFTLTKNSHILHITPWWYAPP